MSTEPALGTDGEAAVVQTDGFSLYTVEFTYGKLAYTMPGDATIPLAHVLSAIGLAGKPTAVETSNAELFSASDESGEWVVTAHRRSPPRSG